VFASEDAGFGFAGLVIGCGAVRGFVREARFSRSFITPPGEILVAVAVGDAFVVSEVLEVNDFAVWVLGSRDEVCSNIILRAWTNEELRVFGVVLVHPIEIIVVVTFGSAGEITVPILGIHIIAHSHLFEVAEAIEAFGAFFGAGECGQKHRCQNRDDGDYDQQFDEGERATMSPRATDNLGSMFNRPAAQHTDWLPERLAHFIVVLWGNSPRLNILKFNIGEGVSQLCDYAE